MTNKPIIIIGNGGHAAVLTDILQLCRREIIGFTAPAVEENAFGITYLGDDKVISGYDCKEIELVNGIGSVSFDTVQCRKNIFETFTRGGYSFTQVIHPKAVIAETVRIGKGVQVMAGAIIQPFANIADNSIINTATSIDHHCQIGEHCHIAPGVHISGAVTIALATHVGVGSTIIQNVKIGSNVLIGAGSVVIRDIQDGQKVYGVPAKEV